MSYEAPTRFTAANDVTGDLIMSKTKNQEAYSSGWDRIFGKKKASEQEVDNGKASQSNTSNEGIYGSEANS